MHHIVDYEANKSDTECWAKCSCGEKGPRMGGGTTKPSNQREMDKWADRHVEANR